MKKVIVVGGGHAGIEAALALTKMNIATILVTGDLTKVASLPCNPSIGGPAKGIVVREIDALGGQMAKSADYAALQVKMLNASKGPAVRALRAQIDKIEYPKYMLSILQNTKGLLLIEGYAVNLIIDDNQVHGVVLDNGQRIPSDAVILTTGTYLNSKTLIGDEYVLSGPNGEKTTNGISEQLKSIGFEIIRLKTGTPPRLAKESVDVSNLAIQNGDDIIRYFSYEKKIGKFKKNVPCYLTYTNEITHKIIADNIHKSAMYSGNIEGVGPRYCPSIEDKVFRFKDKERHQIFLEPESLASDEYYVQGLSTSMPKEIQEKIVHSVSGLEKSIINKWAYAIEYDAINPNQLFPSLESKKVTNLFFAGQINGTSGYEEAAGQGIIAGINAGLKLKGESPLILKRNEAYIGVLIDDLVTKGTKEPYRLLTSRAEYRLLLRHDNADLRLLEYGYNCGLISEERFRLFTNKQKKIKDLISYAENTRIEPNEENNLFLNSMGSASIKNRVLLADIIKRPEINAENLHYFLNDVEEEILEQIDLQIKYDGYIKKSFRDAEKLQRLEMKKIPVKINYDNIKNISSEAREKLKKIMPLTIGQASRILGVNPTDILVLSIYIETGEYKR